LIASANLSFCRLISTREEEEEELVCRCSEVKKKKKKYYAHSVIFFVVATGRVPVPHSRGVSTLRISKPPWLCGFFLREKKLLLLLRFGRIRKRRAATAGHKRILEGGTALLLFFISFPKAPWTTSRSSRVENQEEDNQVFVSTSSSTVTRRVAANAAFAPLSSIALPSIAYFSPSRDAKASSPFLPSRLEKFIDRQKADRRVEGEETNGVRRFSGASGRRRKHQVFLADAPAVAAFLSWRVRCECFVVGATKKALEETGVVLHCVLTELHKDDNHPGGARRDTQSAGGVGRA
jgi:hypothetical protein